MHTKFFILFSAIFTLRGSLCALTIAGYNTASNDRFANNAGFLAASFDLSGVGISSDGHWATLIAPNVFLSANHYFPGNGSTLTLYKTNDPDGPSVTRTVTATKQRVGTSDLLICTLNLPVPEGYAYYSYATESLSTPYSWFLYPYRNQEVYHFGRSPGSFPGNQDIGVGKNVVDYYVEDQVLESPAANGPTIICEKNTSTGAIPYETIAQGGDSGAPLFWDAGGNNLRLIGVSWFITQDTETLEYTSTGFTAVGNHSAAINTFLTTYALPYQPQAPSAFIGNRISSSRIDLSWQDNSGVETSYVLERAEAVEGPWMPLSNLPADSESYSDTSAPEGNVFYRLTAQNVTASDPVPAALLTQYNSWAVQFDWGSADQTPTADANSDGITNMAAYSMDLPPIGPVPAGALPYLETSSGNIDYFFRKNPDAADIRFVLQSSGSLTPPDWQELVIDGINVTETDLGPVDDARLIRIRMPATLMGSRCFFRLQINISQLP